MKFSVRKNTILPKTSLIYREEDYSFDMEPLSQQGHTSILINDLHFETMFEGKIIYLWGLCPLINYLKTNITPKNYIAGEITVTLNNPTPGISKRLNDDKRWPIYINQKHGWVCIGDPETVGEQQIEFLPSCIAVFDKQTIIAIWLKPKILE